MTKVLIYIGCNGCKHYAIVAPNGVKIYGGEKWVALIGAKACASFQMTLTGRLTEKQFRNKHKVIGSFMVKHAE